MKPFANRLLDWFDQHGRKTLPWQDNKTPYRVWVSEIMLQQTQVATVIPYFERFMRAFPTVDVLAHASEDDVLHLWTGLGYYARARNLHATAKKVVADYNGEFPASVDELTSLPGIGRSTAGAIVAICFGKFAVILDGNVKRVLARYFTIEGWPGRTDTQKQLWAKAEAVTPRLRTGDYTQAIMDLGATVCTRTNPDCIACPFSADCVARKTDAIDQYPGKKPKKVMPVRNTIMLVLQHQDAILLEKRPSQGLWGGLWSFPECKSSTEADAFLDQWRITVTTRRPLGAFRHSFTHYHLDIEPLLLSVAAAHRIAEDDKHVWFNLTEPPAIGLTKPVTKILATLASKMG